MPNPASYPDVSLDVRAKYPSHGPLRFITSHSFRARLCLAKNEAPEEEAVPNRKEGKWLRDFNALGKCLLWIPELA